MAPRALCKHFDTKRFFPCRCAQISRFFRPSHPPNPATPRPEIAMKKILLAAVLTLIVSGSARAQYILTGTNYSQNFNSLGNGLPTGWTTRVLVASNSLGNELTFSNTNAASGNTWGDGTGAFKNFASATGLTSTATTAQQTNSTDRALGIRPTASFGDTNTNYTAFVLQLNNTTGFENFTLNMDAMMLSVQGRTNVWSLDYGIGASPTSFTTLTNWTTPDAWGTTSLSISSASLAGITNQSENVWIRFSILSPSTGSGSRDSVAIDNFSLAYTEVIPEPSTYALLALSGLGFAAHVMRRRLRG